MNPVTRALLQRMEAKGVEDYDGIEAFVENWDELEALIVRVFKNKEASREDALAYHRLRARLLDFYPGWESSMKVFWQQTRAGGRTVTADPFLALLATPNAEDFVDNWTAMQTLPAAREALNQFLLDRIENS